MIARLILSTTAIIITASLMDSVTIKPCWVAVIVSLVLGFINTFIRPVIQILSIPITIITLGLFSFVINALMIQFCSYIIGEYFIVNGFKPAMIFSIILSLVNWIIYKMFSPH